MAGIKRSQSADPGSPAPKDFHPEHRITPLSNFAALRSKHSRFSSYLPIENPSKRTGASPRRKSKSHSLSEDPLIRSNDASTLYHVTAMLWYDFLEIKNGGQRYCFLLLQGFPVAIVTYYVTIMTVSCSAIIRVSFGTTILLIHESIQSCGPYLSDKSVPWKL